MGSPHSKSASTVNTSNENEKHDVFDEFLVGLNATQLNALDFRLIKECGKQIEGIHNPLTIIVSYQSIQSMMIIEKNTLLCQARTHQETKQWMTRTIRKLNANKLLAQYDGLIFVMLCIAKVKEANGVKTLQEYHDAKGAIKHTDKLRKDVSFRLGKLHFHWDTAVQYTVTSGDQRLDPKNYNTMQVAKIKTLLLQQAQQQVQIDQYCRSIITNVIFNEM
eukprot:20286_1